MSRARISTLPPEIRGRRPMIPALGGALPPSGTLPPSLRKIFHPSVLQALEGLWQEIESQALTPLFLADPQEGLTLTFQRVYPRFAAYYLSATLTLVASLEEPQLVGELVGYSFDTLRDTLRARGPECLGREPTLAALIGVHSMTRIFKAAAHQLVDDPTQREQLEAIAGQWTATAIAYMLTMFAVSYALAQDKAFAGRWGNVATLAHWSQAYAAQVYDLSTRHGLLRSPTRPPGAAPVRSTEEDLQLADAGLEDYAGLLEQKDEQSKGLDRRITM